MFYLISGAWAKMGTFKMILWLAHANCQFSKMVDNEISGKIPLLVFTKSAFRRLYDFLCSISSETIANNLNGVNKISNIKLKVSHGLSNRKYYIIKCE